MQNKNDILYTPNLARSENWKWDGSGRQAVLEPPTITHDPEDTISKLDTLGDMMKHLPYPASDAMTILLRQLMYWTAEINEPLTPDVPTTDDPVTPDTKVIDTPVIDPDLVDEIDNGTLPGIFDDAIPPIDVVVEAPISILNAIGSTFQREVNAINDEFTEALQVAMQSYLQQAIVVMGECYFPSVESMSMPYTGTGKDVPSTLAHLNDFIVRSQITKEQKARLLQKTHSAEQTLFHMRATLVAKELRKRYYSLPYGGSSTFTDSACNEILLESRKIYDQKYKATMTNYYKFLQSSLYVVSDILDSQLKEAQAKGRLKKAGVNIFASTSEGSTTSTGTQATADQAEKAEKADKGTATTKTTTSTTEGTTTSSGTTTETKT